MEATAKIVDDFIMALGRLLVKQTERRFLHGNEFRAEHVIDSSLKSSGNTSTVRPFP